MGTLAEAMAPSTRSTGPAAVTRRRCAGVRLHDGAVLGHEAQDAGAQRGDGEAQLQARAGDQGRVDGPDPGLAALPQGTGQRLEVQDRTAAAAQVPADPGQPEPGPGDETGQVALAPATGPAGLTPPLAAGVARWHDLVARQHRGGCEGKGRAGALGDLLVDFAAERRAVECAEPGLLAEHVVGLGPRQHVALDLVHPVLELGQGARLGQDGGGDGAGRGGGDDVRDDPLHADQVLEHPDLEGSLGPTSGQHERGGSRAGSRRHRTIVAPPARQGQRRLSRLRRRSPPRPGSRRGRAWWPTPSGG